MFSCRFSLLVVCSWTLSVFNIVFTYSPFLCSLNGSLSSCYVGVSLSSRYVGVFFLSCSWTLGSSFRSSLSCSLGVVFRLSLFAFSRRRVSVRSPLSSFHLRGLSARSCLVSPVFAIIIFSFCATRTRVFAETGFGSHGF